MTHLIGRIHGLMFLVILSVSATLTAADNHLIVASKDLFDASQPGTLGLATVPGTHTMLYRASKDTHRFCHHPQLFVFKGRMYCMWSNGLVSEDQPGQRILYTVSDDGSKWSDPQVLATDSTNRGACVAVGFLAAKDSLLAFFTVTGGSNFHPDTALWAKRSTGGMKWDEPQRITSGFFVEAPRRVRNGRLLLSGETVGNGRTSKRMRLLMSDQPDGLGGWREAAIRPGKLKTFGYTEPNLIDHDGGEMVMLFRNDSGFLYASKSHDNGGSWTVPAVTNFPDSTARFSTGRLPDGTCWLISNPMPKQFDRSLLTIALSRDGVHFDRAFIVRGEPTKMRFAGKSKLDGWQYPNAIVHNGFLFVAYSINKEDVGMTRIALSALAPEPNDGN